MDYDNNKKSGEGAQSLGRVRRFVFRRAAFGGGDEFLRQGAGNPVNL